MSGTTPNIVLEGGKYVIVLDDDSCIEKVLLYGNEWISSDTLNGSGILNSLVRVYLELRDRPVKASGHRPTRDETGLALAKVWAERGTCARRKVGCVLMDADGQVLSSGYNGPAAGQRHCTDRPCPGADAKPGTSLEICEAIHAESNALMRCQEVRLIHTCYVTHSPCLHCVKMLLGTGCQRIVFGEEYAHNEAARLLWMRTRYRKPPSPQVQEWVKL